MLLLTIIISLVCSTTIPGEHSGISLVSLDHRGLHVGALGRTGADGTAYQHDSHRNGFPFRIVVSPVAVVYCVSSSRHICIILSLCCFFSWR